MTTSLLSLQNRHLYYFILTSTSTTPLLWHVDIENHGEQQVGNVAQNHTNPQMNTNEQ